MAGGLKQPYPNIRPGQSSRPQLLYRDKIELSDASGVGELGPAFEDADVALTWA